jgi:hypothetical protein
VATLGSESDAQRIDSIRGAESSMDEAEAAAAAARSLGLPPAVGAAAAPPAVMGVERFYLQYFFPPSSVGECGRVGPAGACVPLSPSRWRIALAALACMGRAGPPPPLRHALLAANPCVRRQRVCARAPRGRVVPCHATGRRELGHGELAQRALAPAVPPQVRDQRSAVRHCSGALRTAALALPAPVHTHARHHRTAARARS